MIWLRPSRRHLAFAAMAIPGTLLPFQEGLGLNREYWTLGWPLKAGLTIFGPGPNNPWASLDAPVLAFSLVLWFFIAWGSHRVWRGADGNDAAPGWVVAAGMVCTLWGVTLACFGLGVGGLVVNWRELFLDAEPLEQSAITVARFYPVICLGFLAAPFLWQWMLSRRYTRWRRAAFVSVPVLLFALLSSPLRDRAAEVPGIAALPIVPPIPYAASRYALLLEFADQISRNPPRAQGARIGSKDRNVGVTRAPNSVHFKTNRVSPAAGGNRNR